MNTRDEYLTSIRPEIPTAKISETMSSEEYFQNKTLRPIAKLQNDLLLASFRNYIIKHKNVFFTLTVNKRLEYIDNAIQKDTKYRNNLKGVIIGQFTLNEYQNYTQNSSALNKRMMNIIRERLQSQVQLLENESILT